MSHIVKYPPTRVGVLSILILCSIQNLVQNPKFKIRNPKSRIQNLDHWGPRSQEELQHNDPKSEIQNPRNPAKKVWILDLGGSRGCTTRQFSDGALRSEARIPAGPPTVSDRFGGRKETRQQRREREGAKTTFVRKGFAAVGLNKGHNQPHLIRLGEEKNR